KPSSNSLAAMQTSTMQSGDNEFGSSKPLGNSLSCVSCHPTRYQSQSSSSSLLSHQLYSCDSGKCSSISSFQSRTPYESSAYLPTWATTSDDPDELDSRSYCAASSP